MKTVFIVIEVIFLALTVLGVGFFYKAHDREEDQYDPTKKLRSLLSDGLFTVIFGIFTIIAHLEASYFS